MKKSVLLLCSLLAVVLLVLSWAKAQAEEPIKIGTIATTSGRFAAVGLETTRGFELALKEAGGQVAGRRIQLINEDDEGVPQVALTKLRKLVERDKVRVVTALVHSGVGIAILPYLSTNDVTFIHCVAGTMQESGGKKLLQNIFRVCPESYAQTGRVMGRYPYEVLGWRKGIIFASDYVQGRNYAKTIKENFEKLGGKILQEFYPAMTATDFAPYITAVKAGDIDGAWTVVVGSVQVVFHKQWSEYGLQKRIPKAARLDEHIFPALGDSIVGMYGFGSYTTTLPIPENQRFVTAYQKAYGEKPGEYAEGAYVGLKAVIQALKAVNGKVEDTASIREALRSVEFTAPRGKFAFDANQFAVADIHVQQALKVGPEIRAVVIDMVRDTRSTD